MAYYYENQFPGLYDPENPSGIGVGTGGGVAGGAPNPNPSAPSVLPTVKAPPPFQADSRESAPPEPTPRVAIENRRDRQRIARERFTSKQPRSTGINL